jgi:hypothetical protein
MPAIELGAAPQRIAKHQVVEAEVRANPVAIPWQSNSGGDFTRGDGTGGESI